MMKVALYDARPDSPTYQTLMELFIGEKNPIFVSVPPGVNVGLEIPNCVGIILPTPLKSIVNSLSNIRIPLFCRFMLVHP